MHPKALLDHATALVGQVLRLDHPADAVVSRYFREHRELGSRERATLTETVYTVLRRKPYYELLARSGSGARERRLAFWRWPHRPISSRRLSSRRKRNGWRTAGRSVTSS